MDILKGILIFFILFVTGFVVIAATIVIIFPVSWNDVVTSPAFLVPYVIIGGVCWGAAASNLIDEQFYKQ